MKARFKTVKVVEEDGPNTVELNKIKIKIDDIEDWNSYFYDYSFDNILRPDLEALLNFARKWLDNEESRIKLSIVCSKLADSNNLEAVEKCASIGFPKEDMSNKTYKFHGEIITPNVCFSFALNNNVKAFKKCAELGFTLDLNRSYCEIFAKFNNLLGVEACVDLDCVKNGFGDSLICYYFAKKNNLEAIKRCVQLNFPKSPYVCEEFDENGNMAALRYVVEEKFPGWEEFPEYQQVTKFVYPNDFTIVLNDSDDFQIENATELKNLMKQMCLDFIEGEESSIETYLKSSLENANDKHIVIVDENLKNGTQTTKSRIAGFDKTYITLPCVGRQGTAFPVDENTKFLKMNLSNFTVYVPLTDVQRLLEHDPFMNVWMVKPSLLNLSHTASQNAVNRRNYVSSNHCQSGTDKKIYRLIGVNFNCFESSLSSEKKNKRKRSSNNNNSRSNTNSYNTRSSAKRRRA
jgi:hypothetical protein